MEQKPLLGKIHAILFSTQGLPIFLNFAGLAVLFVLFRMKGLELDYKLSDENSRIAKITALNKQLKLKKAQLLSVEELSKMAERHKLKRPNQDQVIVIQ